jgi:hypothetical protein
MNWFNELIENAKRIAHSDDTHFEDKVKKLLLYRKIVKVERDDEQTAILTLDNGTTLIAIGNEGCGGCSNGWYYLDELNGCENAITDVKCEIEGVGYEDVYHLYIFADNKKINCLQYSGSDNGYYGTGYNLYVKMTGEG